MEDLHKKNIIIGTLWALFGQFGYMLVALIANIILARILTPYEFGQVGIVMFFIIISKVFTESGLSGAIIRKKDATPTDYSTVFIFNLIISLVLVVVLFFAAEPIAHFYNDIELKDIIRVSSAVLIIYAFQITHITKLVQQLQFRKKAIYEFIAILISAITAITFAYKGFGVWAIVLMQILTASILSLILWMFEEWPTVFVFSTGSFMKLYNFGINTTFSSLLNTVFDNVYQLILGKYFAINQTGLYYQAKKIHEVPVNTLGSLAHSVIFSSLAKVQDDKKQFNLLNNKISTTLSAIMGLVSLFVIFYSKNLIIILFGEQWLGSVFFLQILIVAGFFQVHEIFNHVIFKTFDQTQKILYLEIVKKIILSISIIVGVILLDISILLYGYLFTSILSYFLNSFYSSKVTNESFYVDSIKILKIIISASITISLLLIINSSFNFKDYYSFLLIPVMLTIYFVLLRIMNVYNLINDTKIVYQTIFTKK
tara:strand:+ start:2296 stop:3747 length:1452 start_codon:yes stop_codon:yes gene_type:complete